MRASLGRSCRLHARRHLSRHCFVVGAKRVDMHRVRNILHGLLASVGKGERHLIAHLLIGRAGDANAAGLSNPLQPCGNVHAVTEDVATIDDDVADIDADAKLDPLLMWHVGVALRHATLNIDGTAHRVHDAVELGQQPIAGVLDDPPTVLRDLGIDEGTQMVLELDVRGLFIEAR